MQSVYEPLAMVLKLIKFSYNTANDRVLLQRKVYLAQVFGCPLGLSFVWSIDGVYSEDLAAIVNEISPEIPHTNILLKPRFIEIIKCVNDIEKHAQNFDRKISVSSLYDLIATIAYFYNRNLTADEILDKVKEVKPQFTPNEINKAIQIYLNTKEYRGKRKKHGKRKRVQSVQSRLDM